ncbi:hypothetical protein ACET3X_003569 [Alternaria dauci]|uniref:Rhodopsin domain-containing protein n=1 Tax=Alternaria dauci TaxID=48095 RepID=A0ABR3UT97_9PLEO
MSTPFQRADAQMNSVENEGTTILTSTLAVTTVAMITTIARLYVRIKMIRNVGWDDYMMLLTMILSLVGQGIIVSQVSYGAGRHIEDIPREDFKTALKLNFITQPLFLIAICCLKLSVGFFLLRIAVKPYYRRIVIGIMIFMSIYTIGCLITLMLQCSDIRMMYDRSIKGRCWSNAQIKVLAYLNTALNICTDIAFSLGIPIPMLWGIQMNRRHKASLICILGLGTFATTAALVKLSYMPNYGRDGDLLWDSRNLTIWTVAECCVGMVAANLSCLKPLVRSILVSTDGRGSRKASQPKSNAYARGTNHRSLIKSYGPLDSDKASDNIFAGHGPAGKAYLLTTIDAAKDKTGQHITKISSGRSSPAGSRSSNESETMLNNRAAATLEGHNITVTTQVNVTQSLHSRDGYEGGKTHGQHQAKELV